MDEQVKDPTTVDEQVLRGGQLFFCFSFHHTKDNLHRAPHPSRSIVEYLTLSLERIDKSSKKIIIS